MILIGLLSFQYYGASWDESTQRLIGEINWRYAFLNDKALLNFPDGDHGVGIELPLYMLERVLGLKDAHDIYMMRHLVTHLIFLVGAFFFYRLTTLLYNSKVLSTIAFLLYMLHPHIYAHSFFNSKDVPFLSLFVICFYLCVKLLQNKKIIIALILGACMGLLINIRMMGLLLLVCILFFLIIDAWREKKYGSNLVCALCLIFSGVLLLYASWPYLWSDPFGNFFKALGNMSHFRWPETNLYDGKNVPGTELGWEYIPLWFSVTTPLPFLAAGLFGAGALIRSFIKYPSSILKDVRGKLNLIFLVCFFVPVIAVIALHSVLYDGWRHLFFIYPPFCMLLIFGLSTLLEKHKRVIVMSSALSFSFVIFVIVTIFPFEHVYFNPLVSLHSEPEYIRKHYNMDYWGTSYKQSLEYIVKHDASPVLYVFPENYPGYLNAEILPYELRERLVIVQRQEDATYFVTNFRWHEKGYPFENKKIYDIRVLNSSINSVYKLK